LALQDIPLDNSPNQTWSTSVAINGGITTFFVTLRYSEVAGYWVMSIQDSNQNLLLDSVPLVTGLNILQQYGYLDIGSIYILNTGNSNDDYPNNQELGNAFSMVWGDNPPVQFSASGAIVSGGRPIIPPVHGG
jgi:hypothetical protein